MVQYICTSCNYKTLDKSNYNRHIKTKTHIKKDNVAFTQEELDIINAFLTILNTTKQINTTKEIPSTKETETTNQIMTLDEFKIMLQYEEEPIIVDVPITQDFLNFMQQDTMSDKEFNKMMSSNKKQRSEREAKCLQLEKEKEIKIAKMEKERAKKWASLYEN